jgi:membrane protease YdiL (CAAX protease family)
MSGEPPVAPSSAGAREGLWACGGLLLLLAVGKSSSALLPHGADLVFTLAAGYQLYVPLWLIQRRGELPESHAIHVHGLLLGAIAAVRRRVLLRRRKRGRGRRGELHRWLAHYGRGASFRPRALALDMGLVLVVCVVTFVPFALGHHLWQLALAPEGTRVVYTATIPAGLLAMALKNIFLVALPEELFYRGFLETRLERLWPTRRFVLGIPLGRTVILASFLFALGHWLGEWGNPARFGPFFPAFLFSMLTRRSGSIAGAVVYHGLSNAFSATLLSGYRVFTS